MIYTCLLYEVVNNVCTITLNRPEVFNAFNEEQSYELQGALKEANKDKNVRVIVLTGAGRAFCSGQDLKSTNNGEKRSLSDSLYKRYNPIIKSLRSIEKPIICKLNGVAAGAGASIALACDMIIASETAVIVEAFVGIGLVLDSGSSYFLPKLIGSQRAFELAAMGSKITAQKAFEWGMINKVCSPESLDLDTETYTLYFANAPTKAIGLMKKMLNKAATSTLEEMLQYEAYCQEIAGRSLDYKEGVTAFNEKRKPVFKGE